MHLQNTSISELGFRIFFINTIGPAFLEKSPIAQPKTRISKSFVTANKSYSSRWSGKHYHIVNNKRVLPSPISLLAVMDIKLSSICLFTVSPITEAHFKRS